MENGPSEINQTALSNKKSSMKDMFHDNEIISGKNWQKSGVPLKHEVHMNSSYSSNGGGDSKDQTADFSLILVEEGTSRTPAALNSRERVKENFSPKITSK